MAQPLNPSDQQRQRIVIVGANFAGLTAAQHLGGAHAVTVIDRSPWFEWLPNIHELLSGVRRPAILRLSRPHLIARTGHRFVRATVAAIDVPAAKVITADGRDFGFDVCIVALGGVNDTFGVPGADRYALPFKSVDQCHAIGRQLAMRARRPGRLSVVIVGGGLEGVEALGEVLRRYRHRHELTVRVIEGAPTLLPGAPPALDAAIRARCAPYHVRFHTRTLVTKVTKRRLFLNSGETIPSDVTIWTGGATAPALLQAAGLADRSKQWAPVTETLQSRRFDNVFVIGDAAALPRPISKQAYYAIQMGTCAADNVERALTGQPLRPFTPSAKPMLLSLGDLDTFLVTGDTVIAAPALAALKEAVFQITMPQVDPPTGVRASQGLTARFTTAATNLALPTVLSREALGRVCRLSILRRPGAA
ncbi:MAG: FAD-dependent pyridine nucleotide-disulfide oxidoreductase [Deltaproteobacteria bacterium]|jgi:NADH dehydrogenase|nr:FAD-dependent pyridine nucleotide-disulfide oxidoreductase [Deltaproteobacteria bacterium]